MIFSRDNRSELEVSLLNNSFFFLFLILFQMMADYYFPSSPQREGVASLSLLPFLIIPFCDFVLMTVFLYLRKAAKWYFLPVLFPGIFFNWFFSALLVFGFANLFHFGPNLFTNEVVLKLSSAGFLLLITNIRALFFHFINSVSGKGDLTITRISFSQWVILSMSITIAILLFGLFSEKYLKPFLS